LTELARLELAVCALAGTVLAVMVVVGVDALRFHGASPVLALEALVLAVMAGSFAREAWRQRAFRARLPASRRVVCGASVLVVPSRRPLAFCLGLVSPAVVLSDGLIASLSEPELRSVIAHERHHARRRDPLRRALVKAFCDGFWFLPPLRGIARMQAAVSELAADAVAMRSAGAQPLASALLAFEDGARGGASGGRVRQLLGERAGAPSLVASGVVLFGLGALAVGSELCLLGAPLAVLPAALVSRRAARALAV
jgi:Zn-dependent protease with chaperone function